MLIGKSRYYKCSCGKAPVRPLHGDPKPCDYCGAELDGRAYYIDDNLRVMKEIQKRVEQKGDHDEPER